MSGVARSLLVLLRLRLVLLSRPRASTRAGASGSGRGRLLLRVGVIAVVALGLAVSLGNLLSGAVSGPVGRLLLVPAFTWLSSTASLLLFLVSVPVALAAFTYNSDLKLLLLAPLSPRVVLGEKILSLLGGVALPLLTVGLVIVILIGRALGLGLGYDLTAVVALVLLAAPPLAVAVLLTVAVLRWVPPARARTITAVLGALFGIAVYLGSRLLSRNAAGSSLAALQASLHESNGAWWSSLPTTWPGRALAAAGLGQAGTALAYLAASAVLAALLLGLAVALSAHLFATGWATYQEVGRSRVAPTREARAPAPAPSAAAVPAWSGIGSAGATAGSSAPWWPLLGKEWRSLRRDTQVWSRLIYPLFVLGFALYQAVANRSSGARATGALGTGITVAMLAYALLVVLALPVVNREGRSLYLLALAPLRARDVLFVKWAFCAAPVLLVVEVVLVAGSVLLSVSPGEALLAICAFAALIVALAGALLLVSLIWPRLDWDNPRRQVSGTASAVGALGGLVLVAVTCLLLVLTLAWSSSQPLAATATGIALFALPALVAAAVAVVAPSRLAALMEG